MAKPQRLRRRRPGENTVTVRKAVQGRKGPEILPHYWHPDRDGSQPPPAAFAKQLREIDPDVRVCFSPVHERWIVWVKNESRKNPICPGWQLLFLWEHPTQNTFLPLNELLFHNLVLIGRTQHPSAVAYFERIQARIDAAREAKAKDVDNLRQDEQADIRKSWQISTAGKGNKAAAHHDGTIIPSRGHAAWLAETRAKRLPSEQLQREKEAAERQADGV